MGKHLTIFQKGLLLISFPLLFQLAFLALIAGTQEQYTEAQGWAMHSLEVLNQGHALLASLADAETGMRGWVITDDPAFAEPYRRAVQEVPGRLARLQILVEDNPGQESRAGQIAVKTHAILAWHADVAERMRSGRKAEAVARMKTLEGKRRMDDLRGEVADFLAEEEQLDRVRRERLEGSRRALNGMFLVGGLIELAISGAVVVGFSRGINGRLRILTRNVQRLARGEELAPALPGKDEVARVDRAFHDMARALSEAAVRERDYATTLEQQVQHRTAELAETNRDLAQQNQENELFVYSVSHDLRSPLVNLQGFSKELSLVTQELRAILADGQWSPEVRQRGLGLVDQDMAESIRFIQTAVSRLSNIIDALLRLSRVGRVEYQPQAVDVVGLARRVVTAMRSTVEERGATVLVHDLPPAWGDPTAVEQVFANLIGNALNYLDPNRPGRIEVGSRDPSNGAQSDGLQTYHVKDNGLGIPAAYQHKVFQAFQRVHPEVARGEGMGLAIVRRIVERHRGRLWVESTCGEGSTFFVALPNGPVQGGPPAASGSHAGLALEGGRTAWPPNR